MAGSLASWIPSHSGDIMQVPCAGLEALALSSGGRLKGGRSGTCMPGLLILDGTPDEVPDSCADEDDAYWLPGKTYAGIAATRAQKKVSLAPDSPPALHSVVVALVKCWLSHFVHS